MCGLNESNGEIALTDTFSITGYMMAEKLQKQLEAYTGKPCYADDPQHPSVLLSHMFPMGGLQAACACYLHEDRLRSAEFTLTEGTAAQQRQTLLQLAGVQDPCAEDRQNVLLRYPFGMVWITADPQSGAASLRITYAVKE
ncbi:MAG TPA: hypothetical protein PK537_03910 [Candidatus Limiplasma sp.]|nr:hypothetical protein [Candidatus Limiplasma sp.]